MKVLEDGKGQAYRVVDPLDILTLGMKAYAEASGHSEKTFRAMAEEAFKILGEWEDKAGKELKELANKNDSQ